MGRINTYLCFVIKFLDFLTANPYNNLMLDATYFTHPVHDWQRRYEALRAMRVHLRRSPLMMNEKFT